MTTLDALFDNADALDDAMDSSRFVAAALGGRRSLPTPSASGPGSLARYNSLPALLYSETDSPDDVGPDSVKSDTTFEVKRRSLLEMIDADHPASPSKDAEETSPDCGSPKRRRSALRAGAISRPSLIEQETAALAVAAALAADVGEYGSDTDTISGEVEAYTAPPAKSYAPRQSLVALTQKNFEQQLRDEAEALAAQQAFEAQQAAFEAQQQQQAAFEAQQQFLAAQQQQQFFAMQQQQQQQQQQQMPFAFAPPMQQAFMPQMIMPPQMQPHQFVPVYPVPPQSPPQATSPPPQYQQQQQQQPARSRVAASPPRGQPTLKLGQTTNLLELAMDKKGSRQLQDGLPKMSDAQLMRACDELGPHLLMLAKHPSANYVVSRLASLPLAHSRMAAALAGHVPELLVHPQGSRVVQAAIAELPISVASDFVAELQGRVVASALDTHGSWGVCAAFKRTHATFILSDVVEHIETLAMQQHGCRVVQRVLAEAASAGIGLGGAAARLLQGSLGKLAVDPFGNYAVQVTMRHAAPAERAQLVGALLPLLLRLSTSKHGSNVAEALLTLASPQQLRQAQALFFADRATLRELMGHPFGNYVLQAMLRLLPPNERAFALRAIETDAADTTFGRTIVTHFGATDAA